MTSRTIRPEDVRIQRLVAHTHIPTGKTIWYTAEEYAKVIASWDVVNDLGKLVFGPDYDAREEPNEYGIVCNECGVTLKVGEITHLRDAPCSRCSRTCRDCGKLVDFGQIYQCVVNGERHDRLCLECCDKRVADASE